MPKLEPQWAEAEQQQRRDAYMADVARIGRAVQAAREEEKFRAAFQARLAARQPIYSNWE